MSNKKNDCLIGVCLLLALNVPVAHGAESGTEPAKGKDIANTVDGLLRARKALEEQEKQLNKMLHEQSERLSQQWRVIDEQSQMLNQQRQLIEQQKKQFEELRLQLDELEQAPGEEKSNAADAAARSADLPANGPVGQAPAAVTTPSQPSDILDRRGVLIPRGSIMLDPTVQYIHSNVTRVFVAGYTVIPAILVGAIDINEADRKSLIAALGARYGLSNRFELNAKIPYVYRRDKITSRPRGTGADKDVISTADGYGLGDMEVGFSYMMNYAEEDWPYFVGSLRIKAPTGEDPFEVETDPETGIQKTLPTGSGFWGLQPGVSFSLPSDPAVLYGSLNYLWNIERRIDDRYGEIDPGDALGFGFGMAVALNPRLSFNLGYSHNVFDYTRQNGKIMLGSKILHVGTFLFGMSYRMKSKSSLSISLGAGVTDDAPDVQLSLQYPSTLKLN
ncbi:MAG: transporter [Pseudomonadota bacterium]